MGRTNVPGKNHNKHDPKPLTISKIFIHRKNMLDLTKFQNEAIFNQKAPIHKYIYIYILKREYSSN